MIQYFVTDFTNDNVIRCFLALEKDVMRIFQSVICDFGVKSKKMSFALYRVLEDDKVYGSNVIFICHG